MNEDVKWNVINGKGYLIALCLTSFRNIQTRHRGYKTVTPTLLVVGTLIHCNLYEYNLWTRVECKGSATHVVSILSTRHHHPHDQLTQSTHSAMRAFANKQTTEHTKATINGLTLLAPTGHLMQINY